MRVRTVLLATAVMQFQGSQAPQVRSCNNVDLPTVPMRMRIVSIPGATVIGDSLGDYVHDRSRCTSVTVGEGFFRFGTATTREWPECLTASREITLDLTRPVENGGSTAQGVMVGTSYMKVYVVPPLGSDGKNAGLDRLSVGQSVPAFWTAVEVTDKATNRVWSLMFNPDAQVCANAYSAPGSTRALITRLSASQWRVDLPAGSIGRLYRGIRPSSESDRGLFYVQAQFVLEAL
jgi:hypothetical protein